MSDPKVYGSLTPDEVEELDNITYLTIANEKALAVALNSATNRIATLGKSSVEFWKKLGARMGFDPEDEENPVKIQKVNGTEKVVGLTEDEKLDKERRY